MATASEMDDSYTLLGAAVDRVEGAARQAWGVSDVVAKHAISRSDLARESGDEVAAGYWIDAAFSLNEFMEMCWRLDLGQLSERMRGLIASMREADAELPPGDPD